MVPLFAAYEYGVLGALVADRLSAYDVGLKSQQYSGSPQAKNKLRTHVGNGALFIAITSCIFDRIK